LIISLKTCPWTTVSTWSMSRHRDLFKKDNATQTRRPSKMRFKRT
jgi:hypothetical protein